MYACVMTSRCSAVCGSGSSSSHDTHTHTRTCHNTTGARPVPPRPDPGPECAGRGVVHHARRQPHHGLLPLPAPPGTDGWMDGRTGVLEWWTTGPSLTPTAPMSTRFHDQALVEEAGKQRQPAITFDVTYRVPHPEGGILRTFDRNLQQRFEQVMKKQRVGNGSGWIVFGVFDGWACAAASPPSSSDRSIISTPVVGPSFLHMTHTHARDRRQITHRTRSTRASSTRASLGT